MEAPVIFLLITSVWILYNIGKNEIDKKNNLKELEEKFLIGMAWTEAHKFHMQEILKIVYDKAAETDEQYKKDYEKILQQIDEKVNMFADEWIKNMNETLGHKTEYQNWKEATRYIEKLIKANKNGSERS
jgi:hypothetical protein